MTFTAPMFWYHQQGQRPHQLPDARSEVKGRVVLRKIRAGYASISPQRTASPDPSLSSLSSLSDSTQSESTRSESLAEVEEPVAVEEEQRLATPPEYESLVTADPPPYAQPLPPTLPGYTALPTLPEVISEPTRYLKQPTQLQRRRYLDALRRRLASAKKSFGSDNSAAGDSNSDLVFDREDESARGVVMYQQNDRWIGTTDEMDSKGEVLPRQRGLKAWLKRAWDGFLEWSDRHPYLYLLAIFVIVIVIVAILL